VHQYRLRRVEARRVRLRDGRRNARGRFPAVAAQGSYHSVAEIAQPPVILDEGEGHALLGEPVNGCPQRRVRSARLPDLPLIRVELCYFLDGTVGRGPIEKDFTDDHAVAKAFLTLTRIEIN
jgi:hypothetical protein